jgi:inhibitor of KinA sporulation pathway (predicted exonuclease)
VIQIGAVKLDKNMNVCGSYQIIVKPKYFKKLHRHVSELTGITQQQMDMGTPLDEAAERFRSWCGKDYAFLTWGPDDIPMLRENLNASGISQDWIGEVYDLQKIFNTRTDGLAKQRSLEYAMDYFGIQQTLPAHDALNDAYFTALVAEKLNVEEGVKNYARPRGNLLSESVLGDADAGEDGYVAISELLEDKEVSEPLCPVCSSRLELIEKPLHSKGQRYTYLYKCKKDGAMFLSVKLHRNFNETWRAKKTIELASEEKISEFKVSLGRANLKRKAQRRRPQRRKPKPAPPQNQT